MIRHGFYKTKSGRRRRYRCTSCRKTFSSTQGTPYYRLQHRRTMFDEVAALSVEGVSKSAIARVKRIAWKTVDRRLEKAIAKLYDFRSKAAHGSAKSAEQPLCDTLSLVRRVVLQIAETNSVPNPQELESKLFGVDVDA